MKSKALRDLSVEELKTKIKDLEKELFNLRFQHGTNQLENPMRMKATKRDIARSRTLIREKENAPA